MIKTIQKTAFVVLTAAPALAALLSANTASAYDRWIRVVNTSGSSVLSVYITHVDSHSWGRDLLGSETLPPGDSATVEPDTHEGYCRFDIKVVYDDGNVEIFERINLCVETEIFA